MVMEELIKEAVLKIMPNYAPNSEFFDTIFKSTLTNLCAVDGIHPNQLTNEHVMTAATTAYYMTYNTEPATQNISQTTFSADQELHELFLSVSKGQDVPEICGLWENWKKNHVDELFSGDLTVKPVEIMTNSDNSITFEFS